MQMEAAGCCCEMQRLKAQERVTLRFAAAEDVHDTADGV